MKAFEKLGDILVNKKPAEAKLMRLIAERIAQSQRLRAICEDAAGDGTVIPIQNAKPRF